MKNSLAAASVLALGLLPGCDIAKAVGHFLVSRPSQIHLPSDRKEVMKQGFREAIRISCPEVAVVENAVLRSDDSAVTRVEPITTPRDGGDCRY